MNTSIMNNEFTLTSISQQAPKKKLTVESILSHLVILKIFHWYEELICFNELRINFA